MARKIVERNKKMVDGHKKWPFHIYKLLKNTWDYCVNEINVPHNSHLILAVSGGSDSLAMAWLIKSLANKLNLKMTVLTIDHGIRQEAQEEVKYVRKICRTFGLECISAKFSALKLSGKKNIGLEEAGREGRYTILGYYRKLLGADFIALGHQSNDLSEDILMRLIRGTGWPALGGMTARDDKRHIIRPILWANPDDLKNMLKSLSIEWREDKSNQDTKFLRNHIRSVLMPLLREINPSFESCAWHLHEFAKHDQDYWDLTIKKLQNEKNWDEFQFSGKSYIIFPKDFLNSIHRALRLRLYIYALKKLSFSSGRKWQINAEKLFRLDSAIGKNKNEKFFQMGNKIYARTGKFHLIFYNNYIE